MDGGWEEQYLPGAEAGPDASPLLAKDLSRLPTAGKEGILVSEAPRKRGMSDVGADNPAFYSSAVQVPSCDPLYHEALEATGVKVTASRSRRQGHPAGVRGDAARLLSPPLKQSHEHWPATVDLVRQLTPRRWMSRAR